jgi:hypothetical protein
VTPANKEYIEPPLTPNEPPIKKAAQARLVFPLPDFIPQITWDAFADMRNKIRAPMTDHAKDLIVVELRKLKEQGYDIKAVLEQSIRNDWRDVFPLRTNGTRNQPKTIIAGDRAAIEAACERKKPND